MANGGDIDGVAVRIGREHGGGRDIAARARPVLDHHLLAPHLGEAPPDDASCGIDGAAGRKRHDQPHEPRGIILRMPEPRESRRRKRGAAERNEAAALHGRFLTARA
jgi:hypothetical protein